MSAHAILWAALVGVNVFAGAINAGLSLVASFNLAVASFIAMLPRP